MFLTTIYAVMSHKRWYTIEILRFHVRWTKQFMNSILEQFYAIKSNVNRSLDKT